MEKTPETPPTDPEQAEGQHVPPARAEKGTSAFMSLGWLDRLLALWILLAMVVGILLGNFAPGVGPALQEGRFAGVSVPIGQSAQPSSLLVFSADQRLTMQHSRRPPRHDVPHPLQSPLRGAAADPRRAGDLEADCLQRVPELDSRPFSDGELRMILLLSPENTVEEEIFIHALPAYLVRAGSCFLPSPACPLGSGLVLVR